MNEELEIIVQKMVEAGETEDNIALVIQNYEPAEAAAPVESDSPVKKKEDTELDFISGNTPASSDSVSSDVNTPSLDEVSDQFVDEPIAQLYNKYKEEGKIKPAQKIAIDQKLEDQVSGNRGFWETAIAVTEGLLKTGFAIPLYQYDNEEDLVASREQKNKTDFLSELPEESLAELRTYAGEKISDLGASNLNILAENKIMVEGAKESVNKLKYLESGIKQLQEQGMEVPEDAITQYNEIKGELDAMSLQYNANVDLIENNDDDIGGFYDEVNLLKKNYGGLDYYKDMARLTSASMMAGLGEFALSTRDLLEDKTGMKSLVEAPFTQEDVGEFRDEIASQQEYQRPQMSVNDVDGFESLGAWAGEQLATQLPVLTVLATTGGTAGLGVLGMSATGQKIGDLETERNQAKQNIANLKSQLDSGTFSEEELADIEKQISLAERSADISDTEMYVAGLGSGALEVLSERVSLGILSKGKRAFMSAKKAGGFKEVAKGVGKSIGASVISAGEEGSAEFVNAVGGNLIDMFYLGNNDVHIFDGAVDALASGSAMGFGMRMSPAVLGMGYKTFSKPEDTKSLQDKVSQISELLGEIESKADTMDPEVKKMYESKVDNLKKEVAKDMETTYKKVSGMDKADVAELIKIDKKVNNTRRKASRLMKDKNVNESIRKSLISDLKTEIDVLKDVKETILERYTPEGIKRAKDNYLKEELNKANAPKKIIDAISEDTVLREEFAIETSTIGKTIMSMLGSPAASYQQSTSTIKLGTFYTTMFGNKKRVLVHEAVHAATVPTMRDVLRNPESYTTPQILAVQNLAKIANQHKEAVTEGAREWSDDLYGTTNEFEFVAEFISNPKFRQWVGKTNTSDSPKNLIQYIWSNILELLGVKKSEIDQKKLDKIDSLIDSTLNIAIANNKKYGIEPKDESKNYFGKKGGKGSTKAGVNTGQSGPAQRPTIEQVGRRIRVINPFRTAKPLVEIPLGPTLDAKLDWMNQKFVDRFFSIKKIQGSIERTLGGQIGKDQNFRQAEVTMHGKVASKLQEFSDTAEKLIIDTTKSDLKATKDGTKVDRLSQYLMARHAQERNEHIRNIPPKDEEFPQVNDAGSGMTDSDAQAILDSFKGKELDAVLELAQRVDAIMEETRQLMLDSGLITAEDKEMLSTYYDNYVPLQGFKTDDLDSDVATAFGLSLNVKGKEVKAAAGRTSEADNVLANIIGFRNNIIVRAEKNALMKTVYNMAKENPDVELWSVYSTRFPDKKWGKTGGGKVGWNSVNMSNNDNYVGVKIDGEQFYIKFENAALAATLTAATVEKTDVVTRAMGKFNRYMSSVLTTYNPEFMISNFERDIQTAIINQASVRDISGNSLQDKTFIRKTVASVLPSIQAIYKAERGKTGDKEIDKYYKEFKEDGAKTDWFYAKNIEGLKKDIHKLIKRQEEGAVKKNARATVKFFKDLMDNGNTAIENGVRLASYMEARKAGVTREDAAEFAKELTINFNQKGEAGTLANTLYLFFNASVQGTVRFSKAMLTLKKTVTDDGEAKYGLNRAQKIAAAITAASGINTLMNIAFSGDDEDGVSFYDKIPDYEKERNFIIMDPTSDSGEYFKVPLPYGYNIFHNLGTITTEVSMGTRSVGDGIGFMINSLVGAFNPLSMPESDSLLTKGAKTLSPTIFRPAIELIANESHFGSTIYNTNFPVGTPKPESQLGRASTNRAFVEIAQFMNEATGGSEYTAEWGDVNPDKLEHMFEFLAGGAGKFVNNTTKAGSYLVKKASGEEAEISAREIPLIRKMYGEPSEFINKEVYYDRKVEIDQLYDEYTSDRTGNKGKKKFENITTLKNAQKVSDKRLKKIRNDIKKYRKIEDNIERSLKMKKAREKEDKIINDFNMKYNKLRKE